MAGLLVTIDQTLLRQLIRSLQDTEPKLLLSATQSAVRTGAYYFREELRAATKGNQLSWPGLVDSISARARANPPKAGGRRGKSGKKLEFKTGSVSSKKGFLGKLSNIFRYKRAPDGLSAVVGILPENVGPKGFEYFGLFQSGQRKPITPAMRGYFGAIGLPLKKTKTYFFQPKRELVEPVWNRERNKLGMVMSAKMFQKIGGL